MHHLVSQTVEHALHSVVGFAEGLLELVRQRGNVLDHLLQSGRILDNVGQVHQGTSLVELSGDAADVLD